jgi:hypothetical protein
LKHPAYNSFKARMVLLVMALTPEGAVSPLPPD